MLTTHIKRKYFWCFLSFVNFYLFLVMQIFMDFLILQIFKGFMQGYERSKDKWYKLPLVGVLPQAGFRLTTAGRGWNSSSGSMPSTPPVTAIATTPCHGVSRQSGAAMLGMYRCVGSASLVCCRSIPAAHLAAGWWHRNLGTRPSVWWGLGLVGVSYAQSE